MGKTYWIAYRLVTTPVGEACMVCTQCGKELSASNPASTFAQHENCTNGEEQQQSVDLTGSADENGEPSTAASRGLEAIRLPCRRQCLQQQLALAFWRS
jgi:hypothetical protein